jgi:hypothetical protein
MCIKGMLATPGFNEAHSEAFAILSSARTLTSTDTVPLAIALWRLCMWGSDDANCVFEGWMVGGDSNGGEE